MDWSVSQVSELERGRRRVYAAELVIFCRVFEISLTELTRGADDADLRDLRIG